MIYEVVIGESWSLAKDAWLVKAGSLYEAVKKAENKRKSNPKLYRRWVIVSIKEIGKLEM